VFSVFLVQFAHYHTLLSVDTDLANLVKAVINNEARYVSQYPYCGAFQPPPESGLGPSVNNWAIDVLVNPSVLCSSQWFAYCDALCTALWITKQCLSARFAS
jgi:meiotically up-regulated gene 157 (Mug157) protein